MRRLAAAIAAVCLLVAVPIVSVSETGARTVLLVSGFHGAPAEFDQMQGRLRALGIPSIEVQLPGEDNLANAAMIRDLVEAIIRERGPGTSVDIVAHSMGGLSSRWYAKFLGGSPAGGTPLIAHYVSLGTPQEGLPAACSLPLTNGGQMCPTGPFLVQLNDGDDTPGDTAYTTVFSTDDGLVPVAATRLDGGACFVQVAGVNHFGLRTDAGVFSKVVSALQGTCPGVMRAP